MSQKSGRTFDKNEPSSAAQGHQRHKQPIVEHQRANEEQKCVTTNSTMESITHCPIDLNTRSLVLKAIFTMLSPLEYEAMVFLFEDIVIFTQQALTSTGELQYIYVDSIEMKDLIIETTELQSLLFHLINFSKIKDQNGLQRERYTYILQSNSMRVKENWLQCIQNSLEQLNRCKGKSLTDVGGDVRVRSMMENSPSFQFSQELRDEMTSHEDANNKTSTMKYCPGKDLSLQKSMKIAPVYRNSPNFQLSRVLQQGLKNQNRDQSDTANTASFTNNGGNTRAKTPMEKPPIYDNVPSFPFSLELRDGTNHHDDASDKTNLIKSCSGKDLPLQKPLKKAPVDNNNSPDVQPRRMLQQGIINQNRDQSDTANAASLTVNEGNARVKPLMVKSPIYENLPNFQLKQELQDGTKNYDDDNNNINAMKYRPDTDLSLPTSMKMVPVDRNSPNLQLSRVLQQALKNKNRDQSDTANATSLTDNGGDARFKTPMVKSPIYENWTSFQISQELRDGRKNHDDASNKTNSMKYCPEADMPLQKPMKMAPNPPNLPPRRVLQQGIKNQNQNQSDTTNAANSINNCQEGVGRFTYVDHIKISDLAPLSKTPPAMLHLSDRTKLRNGKVDWDMFVLEAKSTNVKDNWTKLIDEHLRSQLEQLKRDGPKKPM